MEREVSPLTKQWRLLVIKRSLLLSIKKRTQRAHKVIYSRRKCFMGRAELRADNLNDEGCSCLKLVRCLLHLSRTNEQLHSQRLSFNLTLIPSSIISPLLNYFYSQDTASGPSLRSGLLSRHISYFSVSFVPLKGYTTAKQKKKSEHKIQFFSSTCVPESGRV